MQIAFDATVLHGRKSGIGYYCEELLKGMAALDRTTDFFVFSHRPLDLNIPHANGNFHYCEDRYFPIRAIYLHTLLPGILDRVRPDLCHYTNFLAPITESRPYVVTIHDMGLEVLRGSHPFAKRLYTRNLIPRVARNARLILTNSEYSKWEIVRYLSIPEDRIRVTPLAASSEFTPTHDPDSEIQTSPSYFLYVGNLEPRKNLTRLIEAFSLLKELDHQLWIVGNTWYRASAVHNKVRSLGIEHRVRFLDYVPREALPGLYRGATAFVYPSLLEGFGLPVVEAMACGTPVITSDNSALREIASGAAVLVDPTSVRAIADAMGRLALGHGERAALRERGLVRAAAFSWETTAARTLEAYQEAAGSLGTSGARPPARPSTEIGDAICKTIDYAANFGYPLKPAEIHERLFGVHADRIAFERALEELDLARCGDFVSASRDLVDSRAFREAISDRAIKRAWPGLRVLSAIPFVRMVAFSGSTAHRNMTSLEDIDLFMVVEEGKLWFAFSVAILWAKLCGVRKTFCMNYVLSDSALPLFEHDPFTAQQMASLKPFYGKACYDEFLALNPFVRRCFPNFEAIRHREMYPEIEPSMLKRALEKLLRMGPAQLLECFSRAVLGWYLRRKAADASRTGDCDVVIERRRLKLHLQSHKRATLQQTGMLVEGR